MVAATIGSGCSDEKTIAPDHSDIPPSESIELTADEKSALQSGLDFSFDLFRTTIEHYNSVVEENTDGNFTISPFSGNVCLAMIANSCDDNTAAQISKALGETSVDNLNSAYNKLLRFLSSKEATGVDLTIANSVWYAEGHNLSPYFTDVMSEYYYAGVTPVDFTDTDGAVRLINSWCAAKTANIISNFLSDIDPSTMAAWYNAIHFTGTWCDEFDPAKSTVSTFHGRDKESSVKMMHNTFATACAEYDDFDAVKLFFKSTTTDATSLTVVLPHEGVDIDELASRFTGEYWSKLYFRGYKLTLAIPSFELGSKIRYDALLAATGINIDAARLDRMGLADFDGTIGIGQKTKLNVDEKGAVAATVTGSDIYWATSLRPKEMTFDRPFLFFIENGKTHTLLLAGRINNLPNAD